MILCKVVDYSEVAVQSCCVLNGVFSLGWSIRGYFVLGTVPEAAVDVFLRILYEGEANKDSWCKLW